jgi:hypothetical protein
LLAPDAGPQPWGILTQEQIDQEWEAHFNQVVSDLEAFEQTFDQFEDVASGAVSAQTVAHSERGKTPDQEASIRKETSKASSTTEAFI